MENEKIVKECLRRMKVLKLHDEGEHTCVGDFRKNQTPWKSEFHGILYWLDDEEKKLIEEFEEEHKGLKVYHCIKSHTGFGELLSLLYVDGTNEERFEEDKNYFDEDITEHITMSYTINLDDDICSEFGSIAVQSMFGGLQRIG